MITKDSILYKKAFAFAVRIVRLHRLMVEEKREYVLSKQCLRSGTSIGANIAEANVFNQQLTMSNQHEYPFGGDYDYKGFYSVQEGFCICSQNCEIASAYGGREEGVYPFQTISS